MLKDIMSQLITVKGLKGKQNKKKWKKNIDVSALLRQQAYHHSLQLKNSFPQPSLQADPTHRLPLAPNRFHGVEVTVPPPTHLPPTPQSPILFDLWATPHPTPKAHHPSPTIPAIINPPSAHSYNPSPQDIEQVIERVIAAEGPKTKTIKVRADKYQQRVLPRARNKNKRADQLRTILRMRKAREAREQNKIKERAEERNQMNKSKRIRKEKIEEESRKGRVIEGKKIGKEVYRFKEYIPDQKEIPDKLSHIESSEHLLRDRYDSVFRRGILEPRTIKVMRNKRKHIKVIQH